MARRGARTPKISLGFGFNGRSLPYPKEPAHAPSPEVLEQRRAERAALYNRSEQKRFAAILRKYGKEEALRLGVPQETIDAADLAAELEVQRQARKKARKAAQRANGTSRERT